MSIIKVRAWNKKTKEMIYFEDDKTGKEDLQLIKEFFEKLYLENYAMDIETMLFVGLKDKNKKEICEGDIVKHEYFMSEQQEDGSYKQGEELIIQIGEIVYPDKFMAFMIRGFCYHDVYWSQKSGELEVIGNIYETPELLDASSGKDEMKAKDFSKAIDKSGLRGFQFKENKKEVVKK